MRRILSCASGVALAMLLAASVQAQYNTAGFIRSPGWNLLTPINQTGGCGGGGPVEMAKNPLAPYDIKVSDPKARNVHDGGDLPLLAFSTPLIASSWGAAQLVEFPTWFTMDSLEEDLGVPAGSIPRFDRLSIHDTDGANSFINWMNTNVMTPLGLAALPGDNVMFVATTYVNNTGPGAVFYACTASDDSVRLDVNNVTVLVKSICRGGLVGCQEVTPIFLPSGVSKLTLYVWEGGGGFDGTLGIRATPSGANLADGNGVLEFLGPGDEDTVGQPQYFINRTIGEFGCISPDALSVRIQGGGPGADADLVTVVEEIRVPAGGNANDIVITAISNGGVVSDLMPPPAPASDPNDSRLGPVGPHFTGSAHIGNHCGANSSSTFDGVDTYTSNSNSGGDLWDGANDFEFMYDYVTGDFDIQIEVTSRTHDSGVTRWGKTGLIARKSLDGCSKQTMIQDHFPDLQDVFRLAGRQDAFGSCATMYEETNNGPGAAPSNHPNFYRLTRTGSVIRGYGSDDPVANGWTQRGRSDDWGANMPDSLFVGFANSEHGDGGCNNLEYKFKVLSFTKTGLAPIVPIGKTITWTNIPRSTLTSGLSYDVDFTNGALAFSGTAVGAGVVLGASSATWTTADPDGAGKFIVAQDILGPPVAGSTTSSAPGSYTIAGSGGDIWDGGDQMHYAFGEWSGDFVATARLVSASVNDVNGNPDGRWGRTGLMARQNCDPNSKYSFACIPVRNEDPNNQDPPAHVSRNYHLVASSTKRDQIDPNGNTPRNWLATGAPIWSRLTRKGNYFYSEFAVDNDGAPGDWVVAGGDTWTNAPDTLLLGLCSSSHGTAGAGLLTVEYDNVSCVSTCPIPEYTCTSGDVLIAESFDDGFPGDDVVTNNAGAWTPQTVDGRLRLVIENVGGLVGVSHFSLDGLNAGDSALEINYDAFVIKTDANIEADGFWLGLQQGTLADYVGRQGEGGGAFGFRQGDELYGRRTSIGNEIDLWDNGYSGDDPVGGFGANAGGIRWHIGADFNETYQSAQNHVDFAGAGAIGFPILNRPEGVHVTSRYIPGEDNAVFETWVSDNAGGDPVLVGRVIGPRIRGDAVLTACAANGGATHTLDIDNLEVKEISCAPSASVEISGPTTAGDGETVELTASGSAGTYEWSVAGPATISSSGSSASVTRTGPGVITVTVEVTTCDGIEASDSHEISDEGGLRKPMDMNGDQGQDLSDAVALLGHLFLGAAPPPCGDNQITHPANVTLLDSNGDGGVDLSDAVHLLTFLFLGGPPPVSCAGDITCPCIVIPECTPNCEL